jgi:optic atrophy 3 protein
MRMRLGLLQDPATIERRLAQEAKAAEARRRRAAGPTVKSEAETKAEDAAKERQKEEISEKARQPPRIRPLSEAKAIETGANFISESFMFIIAGGMIVFEQWRSRRKANEQRDSIADRIEALEKRIQELSPQDAEGTTVAVAPAGSGSPSAQSSNASKRAGQESKDAEKPAKPSPSPAEKGPTQKS